MRYKSQLANKKSNIGFITVHGINQSDGFNIIPISGEINTNSCDILNTLPMKDIQILVPHQNLNNQVFNYNGPGSIEVEV